MNFLFICSNIPTVPAYGVYISQLIRHSKACGSYHDFLERRLLVTRKLLNHGMLVVKLKSLPCSSFFDLRLLITPLVSLEHTDVTMKKWTIQKNWQHRLHKTKTNKAKTQLNTCMCWTPLYGTKHK